MKDEKPDTRADLGARAGMDILLVDDHPLVRDALGITVRRTVPQGRIVQAGNGTEALALLETVHPGLIIVDLNMPGMNGLELVRHIRARRSVAAILVFAAEVDPWTVREAVAAGASGYLVKASTTESLQTAIAQVLKGEKYFCPESAAALREPVSSAGASGRAPGLVVLSRREQEVLKHLALGQTTKAIALQLKVSPKTIESHRIHILRKLRLGNAAALARYAIQHGLVPA
jgi:DNA-binding NarL/FixJ family response regulator